MYSFLHKKCKNYRFNAIILPIIAIFFINTTFLGSIAEAQTLVDLLLPTPGTMIQVSPAVDPIILKGVTINPSNPFQFDFIVDTGDSNLDGNQLKNASERLIKYFMTSLTIPESELWVNLSPHENNKIISQDFGATDMGRDLLAQDYILKQLTSSLIYPEKDLGKAFWNKVYDKVYEKYGSTDIPVDTFNKVWIVPSKAVVYEHDQTAFVAESHLKVLIESDYQEMVKYNNLGDSSEQRKLTNPELANTASQIVKELIIPEIEKEVNQGEHFSQLRQITNSLILAAWYKKRLKESILSKVYVDQGKINGVDTLDRDVKNKIYQKYIEAFKKGAFNLIKDEYDPLSQQIIPRKYFSGGKDYTSISKNLNIKTDAAMLTPKEQIEITRTINKTQTNDILTIKANFEIDNAMMSEEKHTELINRSTELFLSDLSNQPISKFVDWLDNISESVDEELTHNQLEAVAKQFRIDYSNANIIFNKANKKAILSTDFTNSIPNDGKMNVFLLRDSYALYLAAKYSQIDSKAFYFSKDLFQIFTKMQSGSRILIRTMITEAKRRMSLTETQLVPKERFQEFKNEFFNFFDEVLSTKTIKNVGDRGQFALKYRDNLKIAVKESISYLNFSGITKELIAKNGVRFIDTTEAGSLVLFLEGVTRIMTDEQNSSPKTTNDNIEGKMLFSNISPAFSYNPELSLNEAKSNESRFYPIDFSKILTDSGEPIISEPKSDRVIKKRFIVETIMMKSELIRIRKENSSPFTQDIQKTANTQTKTQSPPDKASNSEDKLPTKTRSSKITSFDEARDILSSDINEHLNNPIINLVDEEFLAMEDVQQFLENKSYVWKTIPESKKETLLGVLKVLRKYLPKFLNRAFPGVKIKSVIIGGSLVEFWSSHKENERMPFGEDLDVLIVTEETARSIDDKYAMSLYDLAEGQFMDEELGELSIYGVKVLDFYVTNSKKVNPSSYIFYGSGIPIYGQGLSILENFDPTNIITRVETLIQEKERNNKGRLTVAHWLLKGIFKELGLEPEEFDDIIDDNKEAAFKVINANYKRALIGLANKKIDSQTDLAMIQDVTEQRPDKLGGIDLNTNFMDLEINTNNTLSVPVNIDQIDSLNIDGLVPVIFSISPTTNLELLLGISESNPEFLAKL